MTSLSLGQAMFESEITFSNFNNFRCTIVQSVLNLSRRDSVLLAVKYLVWIKLGPIQQITFLIFLLLSSMLLPSSNPLQPQLPLQLGCFMFTLVNSRVSVLTDYSIGLFFVYSCKL